jgi:hypothetical protein
MTAEIELQAPTEADFDRLGHVGRKRRQLDLYPRKAEQLSVDAL